MDTERVSKKSQHKEILKRMRLVRKDTVQRVAAEVKAQKKIIAALTGALGAGPKTVPEMAEATGLPPHEVLWWTASLKKYGLVTEAEKRGAYFAYRLA
jgi:predicted Rossmann fold nucleotide-binding protein DprA/Smf involved in DNA uptake